MSGGHTPGPWYSPIVPMDVVDGYMGYGIGDGSCHIAVAALTKCLSQEESRANARLIAAAPDLLAAQTMGAEANTPDFLDWLADRLVHVYHESPNVDFVHSLRARAKAGRAAITKAGGTQ